MNTQEWGSCKLGADDKIKHLSIGNLRLWVQRKDKEIWIGHAYGKPGKPPSKSKKPPHDLAWSRWAPKATPQAVSIMPVFPDLPLVIHSDYPLRVTAGATIDIYTRIPVWVQISLKKRDTPLIELPSVKLSRTWFGTPVEGEICYWSTTKARRSLQNVEAKPHLVNCPIQVSNKTHEELNFEKFCFRVERLKVFRYNDELWADKSHINYQGEEQFSEITMSGKLPKGMNNGELLSAPRKPVQRSLATRTFRKIFDDSFILGR